ncbi:sentrin-specific protease 5 [Hyperolius riggenbachi]|uniref:sentrin-specific protease 5 n=1 Tax=Hyperolius riggenbachi TaxID=752182 RepID=UPI0035A28F13
MRANRKFLHRRGQFLDWSRSWSLCGKFSVLIKRQNVFLPRKLSKRRLNTVGQGRRIGSTSVKKIKKQLLKTNSLKNRNSRKLKTRKKTAGPPPTQSAKKVFRRNLKRNRKSFKCASDAETRTGKVLRTKKEASLKYDLRSRFIYNKSAASSTKKGFRRFKQKECHHSLAKKRCKRLALRKKSFGIFWLRKCCNLLMMPRKPSPFTGRNRLHSRKLGARKSLKILDLWLWLYKRFWKCRNNIKNKFETVFSYFKLNIRLPIKTVSRSYDMNNNTSGILCEIQPCTANACLREETVKLQRVETPFSNVTLHRTILKDSQQPLLCMGAQWSAGDPLHKKISDVPVINSYPDDMCMLLTEKEVSISSQEDGDVQGDQDINMMLLAPDKIKPCTSENADFQDSTEGMENGEDSCHMELDENSNSDVFNTKLLDHPYCKSPLQDASLEDGLDISAKQGLKNGQKIISNVTDEQLASCICGLLNETMKKYGSLIPLSEKEVLTRLKEAFNEDFSYRASFICKEIAKYRAKHSKTTGCSFRVLYNKHVLDLDDLATLDGQNWINDQVINMYGELIMDTVPDKVHFLNSFFHRQLMTKGYNGVKRWTKKVDVFKKIMLLIPIHLEVHWSLITVNIPKKLISFYDSQGIHFKFCVENIRKYLVTEAKEKGYPEFLDGWQTAVTKCIPQQKNDSDCGVFVLQYCKCLALEQPFQFSQEDMPRVRKRIYKELCECRLMD